VSGSISIGEFSTMTRLSRKALRYYHELGLLEPATVDPVNGYRYYDSTQVELARLIRRFRELDMPVPDLKAYVAAPDSQTRTEVVSAHLDRLQSQLLQTQDAIAALRSLLTPAEPPPRIEVREIAAETGIRIAETVELAHVVDWWRDATRELAAAMDEAGVSASGPLRGSFDHELFADERGDAAVWFPVSRSVPETGRARTADVPGGRFAIAVHTRTDARIEETYALLGTYVAEHGIGAPGPVRERYLAGVLDDPAPLITEIAWPVEAAGR